MTGIKALLNQGFNRKLCQLFQEIHLAGNSSVLSCCWWVPEHSRNNQTFILYSKESVPPTGTHCATDSQLYRSISQRRQTHVCPRTSQSVQRPHVSSPERSFWVHSIRRTALTTPCLWGTGVRFRNKGLVPQTWLQSIRLCFVWTLLTWPPCIPQHLPFCLHSFSPMLPLAGSPAHTPHSSKSKAQKATNIEIFLASQLTPLFHPRREYDLQGLSQLGLSSSSLPLQEFRAPIMLKRLGAVCLPPGNTGSSLFTHLSFSLG